MRTFALAIDCQLFPPCRQWVPKRLRCGAVLDIARAARAQSWSPAPQTGASSGARVAY
jgi:hypothetical protein